MVEPSKELQLVYDKAVKDAVKLKHEYVTLEHLLFAMMCSDNFFKLMKGFGADVEYIKSNLEHFLKNNLDDIKTNAEKFKPKKTSTVERVLNRAFTQVLFNGRSDIQLTDVALSMLSEQKTHANFFLTKGGVDKEGFADYVSGESADIPDGQLTGEAQKALNAFTTNLNTSVKKEKIDE